MLEEPSFLPSDVSADSDEDLPQSREEDISWFSVEEAKESWKPSSLLFRQRRESSEPRSKGEEGEIEDFPDTMFSALPRSFLISCRVLDPTKESAP